MWLRRHKRLTQLWVLGTHIGQQLRKGTTEGHGLPLLDHPRDPVIPILCLNDEDPTPSLANRAGRDPRNRIYILIAVMRHDSILSTKRHFSRLHLLAGARGHLFVQAEAASNRTRSH